jgi:hypothetical protein
LVTSGKRLSLAVALIGLIVMCGPAGTKPAGPADSASINATPLATTPSSSSANGVRDVPVETAWPGVKVKTLDIWRFLPGGLAFVDVAPTSDGKYSLGATFLPHDRGDDEFRDVVLVDRETHELVMLRHLPSTRHQVVYGDADDRWVVWVEASLQPNFEDWQLYAYDRQTHAVKEIAKAARGADGRPVPTPNVQPKVDHGMVVWSAGTAEAPVGSHADSFIADLASGTVRVLVPESLGAVIEWPTVIVARHFPSAVSGTRLVAHDLGTGTETDVGIEGAAYYAVGGGSLAWIDDTLGAVSVRDLATGRDRVIVDYRSVGQAGAHLQFVSLSDRLVAWGQSGGAWAYDRKRETLVRLATVEPFTYVYLNGAALEWLDGRRPGDPRTATVLRMLDAMSLP